MRLCERSNNMCRQVHNGVDTKCLGAQGEKEGGEREKREEEVMKKEREREQKHTHLSRFYTFHK